MPTHDIAASHAALVELVDTGDLDFFDGLFDEPRVDNPGDTASEKTHRDRRRLRWEPTDNPVSRATLAAWAELARTSRRERAAAERENARLRQLLQSNARVSQKIFKLSQKALSRNSELGEPQAKMYLGPIMDIDQITEELDKLLVKADENLTSGHFATKRQQFREVQFLKFEVSTGDAIQCEADMAWLLPFSVDAVSAALLVHMTRLVPREKLLRATNMHEDSHLIVAHTIAGSPELNSKSSEVHTLVACRRHPPRADGSVLILMTTHARFISGSCKWVGSANGEAYMAVTSVAGHDEAALGPLSRVTFCRRSRGQPPEESNLTLVERSRWIDETVTFGMKRMDDKIDRTVQAIENLLLAPRVTETS